MKAIFRKKHIKGVVLEEIVSSPGFSKIIVIVEGAITSLGPYPTVKAESIMEEINKKLDSFKLWIKI